MKTSKHSPAKSVKNSVTAIKNSVNSKPANKPASISQHASILGKLGGRPPKNG